MLSGATLPAVAGTALTNFTPESLTTDPADTDGFWFFLHDSETIEALGAYSGGTAGLSGPAQVGLRDAIGNLLATLIGDCQP